MAVVSSDRLWDRLEHVPRGLLDVEPAEIRTVLPVPTLIHIEGRVARPLFLSVLAHGNETTGLRVAQKLLKKYAERSLPRSLSLFFGNVAAAEQGLRRLDNQMDYNRIWPGTGVPACAETLMADQIFQEMGRCYPFAAVDVHNNTGLNPHYSCIHRLDIRTLHFAALFGRLCIHAHQPKGTQSAAFARLCPAVTLECGKPGQSFGAEHAFEFIDACLHLTEQPSHPVAPHDLELYESVAQVFVDARVDFGFAREGAELNLIPDLDHLNFTAVPAGFVLGRVRREQLPLQVINGGGRDVAADYFTVQQGSLMLRRAVMPSMLTLDERVIRQDCLGYLMERRA